MKDQKKLASPASWYLLATFHDTSHKPYMHKGRDASRRAGQLLQRMPLDQRIGHNKVRVQGLLSLWEGATSRQGRRNDIVPRDRQAAVSRPELGFFRDRLNQPYLASSPHFRYEILEKLQFGKKKKDHLSAVIACRCAPAFLVSCGP